MHVLRCSVGGSRIPSVSDARWGQNYRGTSRNPSLRRRLYNVRTSPTCAVTLIKSRSDIFAVPFISGYYLAVHVRAPTVLPTPWMSGFVARFVGISVFYPRVVRARFRTLHRRIFTEVALALYLRRQLWMLMYLSSFIACNMHDNAVVYVLCTRE